MTKNTASYCSKHCSGNATMLTTRFNKFENKLTPVRHSQPPHTRSPRPEHSPALGIFSLVHEHFSHFTLTWSVSFGNPANSKSIFARNSLVSEAIYCEIKIQDFIFHNFGHFLYQSSCTKGAKYCGPYNHACKCIRVRHYVSHNAHTSFYTAQAVF
jgi:hypothetical protein